MNNNKNILSDEYFLPYLLVIFIFMKNYSEFEKKNKSQLVRYTKQNLHQVNI